LYKHFPNTIKYLKQFAKENNCELQRVIFASLLPEGKVLPHVDRGEYFKYRDRYHLVLKSKGSEFSSGNEKQIFQEGEMWWFANKELHSVKNLDNSERLHIIFDLLPKNHYTLKQKIVKYFFNYFFQKYFDTYGKNEFTYFLENNPTLIKVLLSK
ncbi:MAG: hypothetical protein JWN37_16, partial [Candidatus Nomurabacteria bacterium]|nr:hypothetical protein [Candidatus Nomurabacteria bacterium]